MPMAIRRALPIPVLPVVADSVPDFAGPLAGILAGLDWAAAHAPQIEWLAQRAGRLSVPAEEFARAPARSTPCRRHAACLCALRRMASSRRCALECRAARGFAARLDRGKPAQDRDMDGTARYRHRRLAGRAGRSVLQRQYAGRRGARRAARGASIRTLDPRLRSEARSETARAPCWLAQTDRQIP